MAEAELTDAAYWDRYWDEVTLPKEHRRQPRAYYLNAILDVFDRFLPSEASLSAAEVGGAPGQYLAYIHRSRGFRVTCIDYSANGCRKTIENFRLLGIPGEVIHADLMDEGTDLPTYDVVYSLGLIEHFVDRVSIVERHVQLVRPGGLLILGVPNFRGLTGWFLRTLAPSVYATHVIQAMDLNGWREFEEASRLQVIWKGYIGGFEPSIFARREGRRPATILPYLVARALKKLLSRRLGVLRRINGPRLSGYAMAVYRVPDRDG
ncbi:MAG: class I SAM-dependent methyltransferase [Candidatus Limnocylindria bacterium]